MCSALHCTPSRTGDDFMGNGGGSYKVKSYPPPSRTNERSQGVCCKGYAATNALQPTFNFFERSRITLLCPMFGWKVIHPLQTPLADEMCANYGSSHEKRRVWEALRLVKTPYDSNSRGTWDKIKMLGVVSVFSTKNDLFTNFLCSHLIFCRLSKRVP